MGVIAPAPLLVLLKLLFFYPGGVTPPSGGIVPTSSSAISPRSGECITNPPNEYSHSAVELKEPLQLKSIARDAPPVKLSIASCEIENAPEMQPFEMTL